MLGALNFILAQGSDKGKSGTAYEPADRCGLEVDSIWKAVEKLENVAKWCSFETATHYYSS